MTTYYSVGAFTKLSINGTPYAAISCDLGKRGTILRREGLRGTREHYANDARTGPYRVAGTIMLEPDSSCLNTMMNLAIGNSGNVQEVLTDFSVVVDRYTGTYTYAGCKVNRARLFGSQGGIVGLELDIIGKTEEKTGSVNTPSDAAPFIFADLDLTIGDYSREAMSFELVINNHLDGDRFLNEMTLPQVVELDRTVTLDTVHPYSTANEDLYGMAIAGAVGNLAMNNGTDLRYFTFGALQAPSSSPNIRGKVEVPLELFMEAVRSGNTPSIKFT